MKKFTYLFTILILFFGCKKDLPKLIEGCLDETACNYNPETQVEIEGNCEYAEQYYDCNDDCLNDTNENGICDEFEDGGCTDEAACNYDEDVTLDNGTCLYPVDIFGFDFVDCDGECLNDTDGDGVCDEIEDGGCTDENACNYNPEATDDNGSCQYPVDIYGYDYFDCDGECLNDVNNNNLCDEAENTGCTENNACNYNPDATLDDGSCEYPTDWYYDSDGDGLGEPGSFFADVCEPPYPNYVPNNDDPCPNDVENDADGDGLCESDEIYGCTDFSALNYNSSATEDDGSCIENTGCTNYNLYAGGGSFDAEISWSIVNSSGTTVYYAGSLQAGGGNSNGGGAGNYVVCLDPGCYTINYYDSFGDGWNGASITLNGQNLGTFSEGSAAYANWCTPSGIPQTGSQNGQKELKSEGPYRNK